MNYETRWDFFKPYVEDKIVLDIGPAELVGTINYHKMPRWIHGKITKVAKQVLGMELNLEQVQALNEQGYHIVQGNAEDFTLDRKFDVIVAGDLIEHLSNPGKFLDCAKSHLAEGGKLLITTPNRYNILTLYTVFRTGIVPQYHKPIAKHVMYFDSDALTSLLHRHGFSAETHYCKWVGKPREGRRSKLLVNAAFKYRRVLLPVLAIVAWHKTDD